jgi:hypothetical protein
LIEERAHLDRTADAITCRQRTLVLAIVVLLLYAPKGNNVVAQAGDFGFRFEVGDCFTERLDTFDGVFTKNLGGVPALTVTAHIALTDSQMTAIYRTIEDIRFFDYPSTFNSVPTGVQIVRETSLYNTYHLEVRNAGVIHTVSWKDAYKPTTAEADHLRDFFTMVLGFIHEHPEFKRLPHPTGCE